MGAELETITRFGQLLRSGEVTSLSVTEQCLERIATGNPTINAFISVLADSALADARLADEELAAGRDRGPLHGVPISLKDLIDLRGVPTTAASHVRRGHVASADAPVSARLRTAGAVFLGKTNLHEFALGTTNEDSAFGAVRHPLDPTRSPGGSSGGSSAAVLAGMGYASVGTDTGGSVRIPAAACGLVGLKPSLREIPTDGVVPLSSTLDHIGPIARTVADARVMYDALRGARPDLPGPMPQPEGLRLGVPRGYFFAVLDPEVASVFESLCERLRDAGVVLEDVVIPHAADIAPVYTHIVLAEAAAYHACTLDDRPDDYTANVRIRLEAGRSLLAEDYVRAMRGRIVLQRDVEAALQGRHGLLLPSLAVPATTLGEETVRLSGQDEPIRNVTLRLTQLFNLSGHPALTLPCGVTTDRLPVGAQLVGHLDDTPALLDLAQSLEPCLTSGSLS